MVLITGKVKPRAMKAAFIALVLITSAAVLSAISFVLLIIYNTVVLASSTPEGVVFFQPSLPVSVAVPGINPIPILITILLGCAFCWVVMGQFAVKRNELAANTEKQGQT